MKRNGRWVVEGIWSGYRSSQERPCHRVVYSGRPKYRKLMESIDAIVFTDGTTMTVRVRDCTPREKIQQIRGYVELLNDFIYGGFSGYCYVQCLIEKRKEREDEKTANEVH